MSMEEEHDDSEPKRLSLPMNPVQSPSAVRVKCSFVIVLEELLNLQPTVSLLEVTNFALI
jgi:hypothetical protein